MNHFDLTFSTLEAIESENVEGLTQLLQTDDYLLHLMIRDYVKPAIETGNTEIIQVLARAKPYIDPKDFDSLLLCTIPTSSHNVDKKLEMIKVLMPNLCSEDPLSFYPMKCLFKGVLCCCASQDFILVEFFINNCYAEKYNSHYPLIKELEGSVDGWQHLCVLLHDDIDLSIENVFDVRGINFRNVVETLYQLFVKNTRESMTLAVKTFQALLNNKFSEAVDRYVRRDFWKDNDTHNVSEQTKNLFHIKIWFQLAYNSINYETQDEILKIYRILTNCSSFIMSLFLPFMCPFSYMLADKKELFSLKELSGDVIRHQMMKSENVCNLKEYMDGIWEFDLPTTLKCFLLRIPDPSWMNNNLEMDLEM